MGKIFEHMDELGGGMVAFTPDTPQPTIDEVVHMEQRTLGDLELDNHVWGEFRDMEHEAFGQRIADKVAEGNQLLAQLAAFQGGELRCFVCQELMPTAGDNVRLHDFISDKLKTVGVRNLSYPQHGMVGLVDQTHYGLHGLTDCSNYNGINPTLEMAKVSPCDPYLGSLPFGWVVAPALNDQEQCAALIQGIAKRCGIRVESPTLQTYCRVHINR